MAPLALVNRPCPAAPLGPTPVSEHHVRRVGRGIRRVGRLRIVQSGARPPERGPGRRGAGASWCGRSTRATCGPRCTRTPSPARTSPTAPPGRRRAGSLALIDGGLPSGRYRLSELRSRDAWCSSGDVMTTLTPAEGRAHRPASPPSSCRPSSRRARPPEARGMTRDAVRMLVARRGDGTLVHTHFTELPRLLDEGDLLVVNTSGTLAAALHGVDARGERSRCTSRRIFPPISGRWSCAAAIDPCSTPRPVTSRRSPAAGGSSSSRPTPPIPRGCACGWRPSHPEAAATPTWPCTVSPSGTATSRGAGPSRCTRTCTPPSRARPRCRAPGGRSRPRSSPGSSRAAWASRPIVLHTGVASLEASEPPYPEHYRVSAATAHRDQRHPSRGRTVVAVGHHRGACARDGRRRPRTRCTPGAGGPTRWSHRTPGLRSVDGLLTGWHEPEASHLAMLEAVAGRALLERSYAAALKEGYLWHEFGDVHLVLP